MNAKRSGLTYSVLLSFPLATVATGIQQLEQSKKNQQTSEAQATQSTRPRIPSRSKVYIAPMDGFETHLREAIIRRRCPLTWSISVRKQNMR